MQKGVRAAAVITLAFLAVGMALLPASGQPGQWKAINPVFTTNLNDVWMISSTQGWAVGDSGAAIYWDGTQWHRILTPTAANLQSVACLAVNNCIAVGAGPTLLQWDGTSWVDRSTLIPVGVGTLYAVHIRSDGLGFAVGAGAPNILRLNVAVSPPAVAAELSAPNILRSVWILPLGTPGSIQGFAVGDAGAGWRWDGTPGGWLSSPTGAASALNGIQVLTPNEAIAAGDSDTRARWNGATWTPEGGVVVATAKWRAVYAITSNDEWMVGEKVGGVASIAHWNGVAWSALAPPNVPVGANLNSVYMLSSSDGWSVGEGGAIIRWNGSSWNSIASPVASFNNLNGVWLASSADGWAVGDASGTTLGQIFRWNGANWNFYQTSPVPAGLNAVHGSASTSVFAVGNCGPGAPPVCAPGAPPTIVGWTGGPAWTNISPAGVASNVNLHGVFAISPSLAFAVGDAAGGSPATLLRWDGTLWASIPSGTPNTVSLKSVSMVSSTDGWAVGDKGAAATATIVRWNGAAWASETSPTSNTLNAVQALTSTNVWAVGDIGTIIHRDGVGWSIVPSGVTDNLYSLYMLSATEGWAVGAVSAGSPVILYWDGSTWSKVFPIPPVAHALRDVWMVGSTDGWAVGEAGLILRFGPSVAATATTTTTVPFTTTSTTSVTATTTVITSTLSTQVTSTQIIPTTATITTYVVTVGTMGLPPSSPVPGFPLESILAGLVAGAAALFMVHRRRRA